VKCLPPRQTQFSFEMVRMRFSRLTTSKASQMLSFFEASPLSSGFGEN
jgi:hypothetical protein